MNKTIVLDQMQKWRKPEDMLLFFLDNIFSDKKFTADISATILKNNVKINSYHDLSHFLCLVFHDNLKLNTETPNIKMLALLDELIHFEKLYFDSINRYTVEKKTNPAAVYWPNPIRDPSQTLENILPYVHKHPILNKQTPITSAGSCFAFEISHQLQKSGFNYLIKEKAHKPEYGVQTADYDPKNIYERFSANWGILFNTPSFLQLVQKSFGVKEFPRILVANADEQMPDGHHYMDPFREGVFFTCPEAYEADYEVHLQACRNVFQEAEVFIMTLGLNECWRFREGGAAISRNPRSSNLYTLIEYKTLTVQENINDLQQMIDIARWQNSKLKFIISVSPIPFLATGRADVCHVVEANTCSKSVLRIAAEEIVKNNQDVFYFPSYELVTVCLKDPWEKDGRHVKQEAVDRVMQMFYEMFLVT